MKQLMTLLFLTVSFTTPVFSWNLTDLFPPSPEQIEKERIRKEKLLHNLGVLETEFKKTSPNVPVAELYTGDIWAIEHEDRIVYLLDFLLGSGHACTIKDNSIFFENEHLLKSPQWFLEQAIYQNCSNVIKALLANGLSLPQDFHLHGAMVDTLYKARYENKFKTAFILCAYGAKRERCGKSVREELINGAFHSCGRLSEDGWKSKDMTLRYKIADLIDSFDTLEHLKSLAKDPKLLLSHLPAELNNEIGKYIVQSELPIAR